jgi:hypothetical protein
MAIKFTEASNAAMWQLLAAVCWNLTDIRKITVKVRSDTTQQGVQRTLGMMQRRLSVPHIDRLTERTNKSKLLYREVRTTLPKIMSPTVQFAVDLGNCLCRKKIDCLCL